MPGVEEVERGNDERVQLRVGQEAADHCGVKEARSQRVTRQVDGQSLHLRMRERQRNAEQSFEVGALHGAEAITQDPEHAQGVRLGPHERTLAAASKELQVESPGAREGAQLPDRQGDGRPDGRGHEGTQGPLTRPGLVEGHGQHSQCARIPSGAPRR